MRCSWHVGDSSALRRLCLVTHQVILIDCPAVKSSSHISAHCGECETWHIIAREARSGFQGALLATTHAYDSYGRLVRTSPDYEPTVEHSYDITGARSVSVRSADGQWRKTETTSAFAAIDGVIWLTQSNIVSCSDSTIAPLATSSSRQLTGLTAALPSRSRSTDVRGNVTENERLFSSSLVASRQTVPYATNKPLSISRYGVNVMYVSLSAVTNTYAYDPFGRQIAHTDGRGNTTHTEYNSHGQRSASIDALGNRTTYVYDQFGNLAAVTNPLGNAIVYEYDLRGRRTSEGGATYPVRYTYDVFGNKTTMTTYRDEASGIGDTTTWLYDTATGFMTNKVYADGKGPTYTYTAGGRLSTRTWARGIVTTYTYDEWGNRVNTAYSDDTHSIALAYDAMGRQVRTEDAAGVTTFGYDVYGQSTNETVVGVAGTNVIERYYDAFGRDAGYALNGVRQSTLAYNPATGRLAAMSVGQSNNPNNSNNQTISQFSWFYIPGSDLKSSLSYPNDLTASWAYDSRNNITQVHNATATKVISQYDYSYDAASSRIGVAKSGSAFAVADTIDYDYNARSELTNAVASADADYRYSYLFDGIGNREWSEERGTNTTYAANSLNQYASVDEFEPTYDDDGNQTLVKTATGVWQIQYNGENRPILWTSGDNTISMSYDRMGRRVMKNSQRFVYDGYLQVADNAGNIYVWDPSECVATRPLVWMTPATNHLSPTINFYTHDGNKNVSEVVDTNGDIAAHYNYAPFGAETSSFGNHANVNVWRFSSEYADADLGLVYYNYRHYEPVAGRWLSRDGIDEDDALLLFLFCRNSPLDRSDMLGDSVTGYIDYASYGYFMEIGSRFNFDCFGECIEEWRLDWNAIREALGSSVIPVPKAMGEKLWIEDGVSENTTTLSRVISKVQRLARKLPLGNAARRKVIQVSGWLRRAARNPTVIAAGTASAAITIFEGYYDIGVMFYCCTTCFR